MRNLLTWILAGLSMTGALAIDMYLPSFHGIGASFAASPALVQQTLSAFLFAFAFMMLFSGTLSDSFGRRPLILGSLALYGAASFGAAVAPSLGWLLVCRVLQGLAAGASTVVGRAVIQDRLSGTDAQRMMASVMMVFGLAPAIAPILGGWLHTAFGWRSVFLVLGSFGALMLLVCWRSLPESLSVERRHAFHPGVIAKAYWEVLRDRRFLLLALAFGLSFGGIALYIGSAASFVVSILHLPETGFGWMFIPLIGGMVCGSAAAGRLAARMAQPRQILVGYGVMGVAALVNVVYNALSAAALPWAVLPLFFYAFGVALAMPALTLAGMALFPERSGLAASLQGFVQMVVFALVSGLLAPVLFDSALKLACGVLAAAAVSALCWLRAGGSAVPEEAAVLSDPARQSS
jgi:DHA1 family bicyclomycin/chloramphenicol resistance-like MFS transporter